MPRPRTCAGIVLSSICLVLAGCATYGDAGWGVRTWEAESADRIFGEQPHDRIQVVVGDSVYRLEGARLAADSVIGFREHDDRWHRVAVHRDRAERLEVKKLNVPLTTLSVGATAALWFLP